jgi:ABC-2 type transport system ATP-binding protein
MRHAVETQALTRVFKPKKKKEGRVVTALDSVDLRIERGELFGVLGPNGAGKTTLLKILSTLLLPTSGRAYVAGFDVEKDLVDVRRRINMVSGGEISGYGLLTVRENLWMFSQFYGVRSKEAHKRIDNLLARFGLEDKDKEKVRTLSTGQRQKMNVIRGFVTNPEIIFLDEPTLGLDVNAARTVRNFVMDWIEEDRDRTVLLTTHYMMEADELCDRIAIIDNGRILACDTPENLKKLVKMDSTLTLVVGGLKDVNGFDSILGMRSFSSSKNAEGSVTTLRFVLEDESPVSDIVSTVVNQGSKILSLQKTEPTLEDVFIKLVGRGLE